MGHSWKGISWKTKILWASQQKDSVTIREGKLDSWESVLFFFDSSVICQKDNGVSYLRYSRIENVNHVFYNSPNWSSTMKIKWFVSVPEIRQCNSHELFSQELVENKLQTTSKPEEALMTKVEVGNQVIANGSFSLQTYFIY